MCTTAFLEIVGHQNLAVQFHQKVLRDWLLFWFRSPLWRQDIEETWQITRAKIECLSPQARWSSKATDGPVGGAIGMLLDMGWLPLSFTVWQHDANTTWHLSGTPCDFTPLVDAFNASLIRSQLRKAGQHFKGNGVSATLAKKSSATREILMQAFSFASVPEGCGQLCVQHLRGTWFQTAAFARCAEMRRTPAHTGPMNARRCSPARLQT